jgi:hypothetical protein
MTILAIVIVAVVAIAVILVVTGDKGGDTPTRTVDTLKSDISAGDYYLAEGTVFEFDIQERSTQELVTECYVSDEFTPVNEKREITVNGSKLTADVYELVVGDIKYIAVTSKTGYILQEEVTEGIHKITVKTYWTSVDYEKTKDELKIEKGMRELAESDDGTMYITVIGDVKDGIAKVHKAEGNSATMSYTAKSVQGDEVTFEVVEMVGTETERETNIAPSYEFLEGISLDAFVEFMNLNVTDGDWKYICTLTEESKTDEVILTEFGTRDVTTHNYTYTYKVMHGELMVVEESGSVIVSAGKAGVIYSLTVDYSGNSVEEGGAYHYMWMYELKRTNMFA